MPEIIEISKNLASFLWKVCMILLTSDRMLFLLYVPYVFVGKLRKPILLGFFFTEKLLAKLVIFLTICHLIQL